ncbi:hypothetical protein QBC34DRAFT_413286 [Podospora aff. communis PSN243]|uniref:C2H2-type domain-containing protein n=1 Tax=Podospora aff. communis PSN243 TaxID=3040156 RepID=A0AAV9GDK9_9PEZI|nr:hypothetical protein QBC34DRAFT_413286 [Podospora aff. communis PSN243]
MHSIIADLCHMGCGNSENGPARETSIPSPVVPSPIVPPPVVLTPTIPSLAIPSSLQSPACPDHATMQPEDVGSATEEDTLSVEEGPPSPESGWMSDYSESVPVFEGDHPFLQVKTAVVQKLLHAFAEWDYTSRPEYGAAGNPGSNQYPSAIDVAVLPISGGQQSSQSSGKRLVGSDAKGGGEENGEEGGSDPPKKRRRSTRQSSERRVSLACPFAKKDPTRYRHCYSYILSRTQDVKQHLSRYHQLPIYCPRCKDEFQTEPERDQHCAVTNWSCQVRSGITHEGVTRSQKVELGHRVSPRQTLEEQWFTIFDILFPEHSPRPRSAFVNHHLSIEMEAFQDMMYAEGPALIRQSLQENHIQLSTIAHQEHELEDLFQVAIAEGFHSISQRWMESHSHELAAIEDSHLDGAGASETSRRNARSITSIASSETLVERRRSTRQPQAALGPLNEEGGAMAMMVPRREMPHGITLPLEESESGGNEHGVAQSEEAMSFSGHFLHTGENGEPHHVQENGALDDTFFATLFQDPGFRNVGEPVGEDVEEDSGA